MRTLLSILLLSISSLALSADKISLVFDNQMHKYKSTTNNTITFSKDQPVKESQECDFTIKEENSQTNTIKISFKYDTIVYKKRKKDSTITLCTNNPHYPFEQNLQSLIGSKFYTSISNKGITIDSLAGIKQATDNIYKNFVKLPDSVVVENTKNRVIATFGERYIKGLIEHIFSIIPDSIIKKEGSWKKQSKYCCNFKSSFTTIYRIEEQNNELYSINGITTIKDSTETLFSANGITYLLSDIKGEIKSYNNIFKKSGLLKEGTINLNLKAKATPLNVWGTTEDATAEEITIKIDHRIKENNSHF